MGIITNANGMSLAIEGKKAISKSKIITHSIDEEENLFFFTLKDGFLESHLDKSMALDIYGGNTTKNGTPIILYKKHGRANQKWIYTDDGYIVSKMNENKCITIRNGYAVIWDKLETDLSQTWSLGEDHRIPELQVILKEHGHESIESAGDIVLNSKGKPLYIPKGTVILQKSFQVLDTSIPVNIGGSLQSNGKVNMLRLDANIIASPRVSRSIIPLEKSYLFANTLTIPNNTELVLDGKLDEFVILTNHLILGGDNIKITWSQPDFPAHPPEDNNWSGKPQNDKSPGIYPVRGDKGDEGDEGQPGQKKAEDAPLLEMYLMNISGRFPKISLRGQDGQKGGKGVRVMLEQKLTLRNTQIKPVPAIHQSGQGF